ncbi:MAG: hypothetical protein AAB372_00310 [Patescibacteria group bacterium]
MDEQNEKSQEEEKKDRGGFFVRNFLRIQKAEQVKSKIDTVRDLKERGENLKQEIDKVKSESGSSSGSGASNILKYTGVAVVAAPLVLFGLNHYFKFKINPVTYYDKIKDQMDRFTQNDILLTGSIGVKNQGSSKSYLYCKITAEHLEGSATIVGGIAGPSGFKKDFEIKTGTSGPRFGTVLANEIVVEFDASLDTKGEFVCSVSEMRDVDGAVIKGASGIVATLSVQ